MVCGRGILLVSVLWNIAAGVFRFKHNIDAEFAGILKDVHSLEQKTSEIDEKRGDLAAVKVRSMEVLTQREKADQEAMLEAVQLGDDKLDLVNSGLLHRLSNRDHPADSHTRGS